MPAGLLEAFVVAEVVVFFCASVLAAGACVAAGLVAALASVSGFSLKKAGGASKGLIAASFEGTVKYCSLANSLASAWLETTIRPSLTPPYKPLGTTVPSGLRQEESQLTIV